ncbi:hypothetical protein Tco_1010672, partial [Tanacetum coccineum]
IGHVGTSGYSSTIRPRGKLGARWSFGLFCLNGGHFPRNKDEAFIKWMIFYGCLKVLKEMG